MAQHVRSTDASPLGAGGPEHTAEVAESGSAQQRIAKSMRGNVSIGMPRTTVGIIE
ncbi:hypothetical protein TUM20985_06180 [Mycobacterium antarcticum]|nr:hypothetical protein TUM20985_06180 [Mycolicibacterium sp. TUM20985]GLP73491.1 hypothetical protein TUM20983_06010 [Mycolicibacterium sp. TUM20983]GLP79206.1 hypothetical protein TUM20984_06260 [Mycolicibacterium sp. TUM20984]